MPVILDGKALADKICADLKCRADALVERGIHPKLTIVTSGDDSASKVYVRNKKRRAEEIGIVSNVIHYDEMLFDDATEAYSWTMDPIIYQMPIVGDVSIEDLNLIIENPADDVDGFVCDANVAAVAAGRQPFNYPCTPKGIMRLLAEYCIPLEGKNVCVIGRSNIVGRPLARMMETVGATVTVCHSKTTENDLYASVLAADVVVSATGKRNILTYDKYLGHAFNDEMYAKMALTNTTFVDVGINRDENGKLCGDLDPELFECCYAYTPVPGGVGPMTVAMLMENVIARYER